jgi:AcrR family transcriptional regulator
MGLRERKAEQARRTMVDTAVHLFLAQGFDATTMEQIAEQAEVGTSTLYRYFPTKDLLLLDRLVETLDLAARLRERPADEPLPEALAGALLAAMESYDDPDARISAIRAVVDAAPIPRARLWDVMATTRRELEAEIAARMGVDADDLTVRFTAGITSDVLHISDELRARDGAASAVATVRGILAGLADAELVRPAASGVAAGVRS